jgi:hypothetical protein
VWDLLCLDAAKEVVELSDAYADGKVTEAELYSAHAHPDFNELEIQQRGEASSGTQLSVRVLSAINAARFLAAPYYEQTCGAFIVAQDTSLDPARDFVFDPKVHMLSAGVRPDGAEYAQKEKLLRDIFGNPFRLVPFSPAWRTDTAVSLARQMYESRDFSAMPILADALQDAGCEDEQILGHCRGPGPHVRGCWAIDLVLGKG